MHPDAVDSALLQVRFVALALNEPELLVAPLKAIECVENDLPRSTFVKQTFGKLRALVTAAGDVDIGRACGTSTLARESVPAALAVFLRSRNNFSDAIITAARLGGDTDSICALVGCLAGALHGVTGIPPGWIQAIEHESPSPLDLHTLADSVSAMPPASFAVQAV
jgi:ADP-ribosylglycohydrolase